jgi:hypothetical protein
MTVSVVADNADRHPFVEPRQPCEFLLAEEVVSDQHVLDPGAAVNHRLRFRHLLAGDADRPCIELQLGHLRKLVGFYVRAHADAVPVGIGLKRKDIAPGDIEIDQHGGGFDRQCHAGFPRCEVDRRRM